jgi:hypothetical protein
MSLKIVYRPALRVYREAPDLLTSVTQAVPGESLRVPGNPDLAEAQVGVAGQYVRVQNAAGITGFIAADALARLPDSRPDSPHYTPTRPIPLYTGRLNTLDTLAWIDPNETATVVEDAALARRKIAAAEGHWIKVATEGGIQGWVEAAEIEAGMLSEPEPPPQDDAGARGGGPMLPDASDPRFVERVVLSTGPINYRSAPDTSTPNNILGQVKQGDRLFVIEDLTAHRGDWFPVRVNGRVAWANKQVLSVGAVPPAPTGTLRLKIAHYSQTGPGATVANDCGPACVTAILRAYGHTLESDSLYTKLPPEKRNTFTTFADLRQIVRDFGVTLTYQEAPANTALTTLIGHLNAGKPVICLVNYSLLVPEDPFDGGHFVVAVGYTPDAVLIHDPLKTSGPSTIPSATFLSAWGGFRKPDNPPFAMLVSDRALPIEGEAPKSPSEKEPKKADGAAGTDPQSGPTTPDPRVVVIDTNLERTRRIALHITSVWESGGRYDAYQNVDAGVVSYGRYQFTLAAGTLAAVVTKYLQRRPSDAALMAYLPRLQAKDVNLRNDAGLRDALIAAAATPEMQESQDEHIINAFWNPVQEVTVKPRGIQTPLGMAFAFDMAVQRGVFHRVFLRAEGEMGVPERSRTPDEPRLLTIATRIHRDALAEQARRDNLPGLIPRGEFWVSLVAKGDWNLKGTDGSLTVKGRIAVPTA